MRVVSQNRGILRDSLEELWGFESLEPQEIRRDHMLGSLRFSKGPLVPQPLELEPYSFHLAKVEKPSTKTLNPKPRVGGLRYLGIQIVGLMDSNL